LGEIQTQEEIENENIVFCALHYFVLIAIARDDMS
jgi:hypothetical protein